MNTLDAKIPAGGIEEKWDNHKFSINLVNPSNKRQFTVIVVGTGLAGASAAASLAELGYNVKAYTFHDSPRRAHSIAAQGGINAAKNYQNDGDSVFRLFYDTIKGGDYRSREANVYRLAQVSTNIIDQCAAQGVPFAREYGGLLANRSFGGAQVSRTFYARGQTGQQLLLGAYQALAAQVAKGNVTIHNRSDVLDVVTKNGQACGIITRDMLTGEVAAHNGHAVVLATGGYGNVYYLSTNAMNCNVTAAWRAHRKGAAFANPCYTQIHPTCIPASDDFQSKLTLMSESLRNDGRIWVPRAHDHDSAHNPHDSTPNHNSTRDPRDIQESDRYYYLEEKYPTFGNLVPRDVASRNAKTVVDAGLGVGPLRNGVYLDFSDAIARDGKQAVKERYGNLFDMYERITGENPYQMPMRIYPATHYTMGGLWVDYNLMTTVPGLYAIGECNFSDHGANRLGASALMQGLADGYFVLPYTIGDYLSTKLGERMVPSDDPAFTMSRDEVSQRTHRWLSIESTASHNVDHYHRELGKIVWEHCGMSRSRQGLEQALREIPALRDEFRSNVKVLGSADTTNQSLEKVNRVDDFMELAELTVRDALHREESCGGHFREEHQTEEGEALRDDENFSYVAAWDWRGVDEPQQMLPEKLTFNSVNLSRRSYK